MLNDNISYFTRVFLALCGIHCTGCNSIIAIELISRRSNTIREFIARCNLNNYYRESKAHGFTSGEEAVSYSERYSVTIIEQAAVDSPLSGQVRTYAIGRINGTDFDR